MVLHKRPEEPAETASIALVSEANADIGDASDVDALIDEAGRLLLPDGIAFSPNGDAMSKLRMLRDQLGDDVALGYPEMSRRHVMDALTSVEAAVYLEASSSRYAKVGEAIFGSIDAIGKAHGETCGCAP
jgi:hypothetical protein